MERKAGQNFELDFLRLTKREREALMWAAGLTDGNVRSIGEIANEMGVKKVTAKAHLHNGLRKMSVTLAKLRQVADPVRVSYFPQQGDQTSNDF